MYSYPSIFYNLPMRIIHRVRRSIPVVLIESLFFDIVLRKFERTVMISSLLLAVAPFILDCLWSNEIAPVIYSICGVVSGLAGLYIWLACIKMYTVTPLDISGQDIESETSFSLNKLTPDENSKLLKYSDEGLFEIFEVNEELNRRLFESNVFGSRFKVELTTNAALRRKGRYQVIRKALPSFSGIIPQKVFSNNLFFNNSLVALNSDIFSKPDDFKFTVEKVSYFEFLATCEYSTCYFSFPCGDRMPHSLLRNLYPLEASGGNLELLPLSHAKNYCANVIGVSTLVLTSDNYFVIWVQSKNTEASQGLLAPTGSGSLDWADLQALRKNGNWPNVNELICYGSLREFAEESRYEPRDERIIRSAISDINFAMQNTWLLGGYRWIRRGGKPDFVGITKLNKPLEDFLPDTLEVDNFIYKNGKIAVPKIKFDISNPEISIANLRRALKNSGFKLSLPLHATFEFLEKRLVESKCNPTKTENRRFLAFMSTSNKGA